MRLPQHDTNVFTEKNNNLIMFNEENLNGLETEENQRVGVNIEGDYNPAHSFKHNLVIVCSWTCLVLAAFPTSLY